MSDRTSRGRQAHGGGRWKVGSNRLKARPDRFTRPSASELAAKLGLLRLRDVEAHGIPRPRLRVELREVAPGIWGRGSRSFSSTTVAAKGVPQAVVCLSSALYFHGLLSEEPPEVLRAVALSRMQSDLPGLMAHPLCTTRRLQGRAVPQAHGWIWKQGTHAG
jgi:hypothetical protein